MAVKCTGVDLSIYDMDKLRKLMSFPCGHAPLGKYFVAPFRAFIGMAVVAGIAHTIFHAFFRINKPENVRTYCKRRFPRMLTCFWHVALNTRRAC